MALRRGMMAAIAVVAAAVPVTAVAGTAAASDGGTSAVAGRAPGGDTAAAPDSASDFRVKTFADAVEIARAAVAGSEYKRYTELIRVRGDSGKPEVREVKDLMLWAVTFKEPGTSEPRDLRVVIGGLNGEIIDLREEVAHEADTRGVIPDRTVISPESTASFADALNLARFYSVTLEAGEGNPYYLIDRSENGMPDLVTQFDAVNGSVESAIELDFSGLVSTLASPLEGYLNVKDTDTAGAAETFTVVPLSDGQVALKSRLTGKFVRVDTAPTGPTEPAMRLRADAVEAGAAETFSLEKENGHQLRLKSGITGKYVVSGGLLRADGTHDQAAKIRFIAQVPSTLQ